MSEERLAVVAIWLASLLVPALLFVVGNTFRSVARTLMQAVVAIGAGWVLTISYVVAAQAIVATSAPEAEVLALFDRDGAPRAFASVFGWVPAAVLVAVVWAARSVVGRFRSRGAGL